MQEIHDKLAQHDDEIICLKEKTVDLDKGLADSIIYYNKRFDKGTTRMDGMESEIKKLSDLMIKGDEDRKRNHKQVMDKLDDEKEKKLLAKLEERDTENSLLKKRDEDRRKKRDDRVWEIVKVVGWLVIGFILYSNDIKIPSMP